MKIRGFRRTELFNSYPLFLSPSLQVPEEEVPIRSVTVASDGSCLVAGNNNVGSSPPILPHPSASSSLIFADPFPFFSPLSSFFSFFSFFSLCLSSLSHCLSPSYHSLSPSSLISFISAGKRLRLENPIRSLRSRWKRSPNFSRWCSTRSISRW